MTLPIKQTYRWTNGRLFVFTNGYRGWERVKQEKKESDKDIEYFRWRAMKLADLWKKHSLDGESVEVVAFNQKFRIGAARSDGGFVGVGAAGETILIPKGSKKDEYTLCADRPIWEYCGSEAPDWRNKR